MGAEVLHAWHLHVKLCNALCFDAMLLPKQYMLEAMRGASNEAYDFESSSNGKLCV